MKIKIHGSWRPMHRGPFAYRTLVDRRSAENHWVASAMPWRPRPIFSRKKWRKTIRTPQGPFRSPSDLNYSRTSDEEVLNGTRLSTSTNVPMQCPTGQCWSVAPAFRHGTIGTSVGGQNHAAAASSRRGNRRAWAVFSGELRRSFLVRRTVRPARWNYIHAAKQSTLVKGIRSAMDPSLPLASTPTTLANQVLHRKYHNHRGQCQAH